jgi:ComF family protein
MNLVDQPLKTLCNQLFPPRCVLCQGHGLFETDLCHACLMALPSTPKPKSYEHGYIYAGFSYQNPIDELIQGFKYQEQLAYGRMLAKLSCKALNRERPQALIPVPLHKKRLRQRGFNQSQELARYWGRRFSIPVLKNVLCRHRDTFAQSTLTAQERLPNVWGAFMANGNLPAHVALVDDVYTTGATCLAAAEVLIAHGVQRVDVWCLARVI